MSILWVFHGVMIVIKFISFNLLFNVKSFKAIETSTWMDISLANLTYGS